MPAKRPVFLLLTALSFFGSACASDNADPDATGGTSGTATGGQAGASDGGSGADSAGGTASGGAATGNGGSAAGGVTSTGGSNSGGSNTAGSGGQASGGESGSGTGGDAVGAGGSSTGEGEPEPSAGCDQARTLQNGTIPLTFDGALRNYILRVPDDYESTHPYRLVFAYAESGSSAQSVADRNYFRMASLDTESSTIFVAPDAANGAGSWSASDVEFIDDILAQVEADLCIDKTRIFATGFSFGGAMSLAVACQRADVFRGVAFFSGADLTGSCTGTLTTPIAYYASQASGDSSGDPIPTSGRIKQAQFAEVNGCDPEPEATTFPAPGEPHKCTVYQGCSAGHPTVYCVFDGPHGWEPTDPGESMSWNAPRAWEFITQF